MRTSTVAVLYCTIAATFAALENCFHSKAAASCVSLFADKSKCNDPSLKAFAESCPLTCGSCDKINAGCTDTGLINCKSAERNGQCSDQIYKPIMEVHCGQTCNLCGPNTGKYTNGENKDLCKDVDQKYCLDNEALCNKQSTYEAMTEKCPSTCQRCPVQ